MGRLTPEVFPESCCDGGECSTNDMSAQSCGCDKGANWTCERHRHEAAEATATSPQKRYSITLEVREPDGNQCFCELTLENLIGFSNTTPDSFWTQLLNNLADTSPIILKPEEMDSSRYGRLHGLENL